MTLVVGRAFSEDRAAGAGILIPLGFWPKTRDVFDLKRGRV